MGGIFVYVGSLGAAAFGVLAQITRFRGADDRVTRKAQCVLAGIAASALLSIVGSWLAEREARRQAETSRRSITPGDLRVEIQYSFASSATDAPAILENAPLSLTACAPAKCGEMPSAVNLWSSRPLFHPSQVALSLIGHLQEITMQRSDLMDTRIVYSQLSTFSSFVGEMGSFDDLAAWNGAVLEAHVRSVVSAGLPSKLWGSDVERWFSTHSLSRMKERYVLPEFPPDMFVKAWPCDATLALHVKARRVITARAVLAQVREQDDDAGNLVVAKFPLTTVPARTFNEITYRNWVDAWADVVAYLLMIAMVGAAVGALAGNERALRAPRTRRDIG